MRKTGRWIHEINEDTAKDLGRKTVNSRLFIVHVVLSIEHKIFEHRGRTMKLSVDK